MEFPSFNNHHHHHHHRYVPPPPPPKNFSDDRPNANPHHHHPLPPVHLRPPPQLSYPSIPPPPPQPPINVLPPPPSYNPHQSHFTYLDAQNPPFLNHTRSSPPPPRFSNQSYRFDNWNDSRSDPHRVQPELSHRNPISSNDQHRRLYSPNPQSENYYKPHGSERVIPSSRFRDDSISDGYVSRDISNIVSQEQQVNRGGPNNDRLIGRYASARSVMNMDKPTGSSSRNLEDYVEKYEPRYMTMSEGERIWGLHGEEDPRWVMKGKQNEFGHNDGVSLVSGREQLRDYGYESSKFNRAREGREKFKQVQKKSVLLRIGKPNNTYRNRNHEQHSSKAYLVESNNRNYRGKDKDKDRDRDQTAKDSSLSLEQKMDEDREHSPVELDVSFKSNGLIAKAVLTPSSPMSDNNHTQSRNRKIKRVTEFSSPLSKFSNHSTSGSSSHGIDSPSSSEKAPKQVADKDSVSNVDNGSLSGPVLVPGLGSGRPDGPLSFRLRKKRKLMNLGSNAFNFQMGEKDDKSVKVDNSQDIPIEPIRGSIASPPHEEMISSKSDESPLAVDSEKNDLEVDNLRLSYVKSFGDSSPENKNLINDGLVNDLNQQPCENENLLNLENDNQKISTDVKLSLGGTDISSTLGQDQIEILKCPTESYVSSDAAKTSHDLCNGSVNMQETSTTADMNSLDSSSDEISIVSPENSDVQVCLGDASRKEEESQLLEGTSKQTCCIRSSELLEEGPKESIHAVIVAEDNASPSSSSHKESSSDNDEVTERVNPISTSVQLPSPDHREPSADVKADLPPPSSIISAFANGTGAFTDSNGKSGESMPDMVTSIVSTQNVSNLSDSQMLTSKSTYETISDSSVHKNDVNTCEKSVSDGALLNGPKSFVENSKTNIKTSHSAFQCSSKSLGPNSKLQGLKLPMKPQSSVSAGPRVFAGRSTPVFTNLRINNLTNKIAKPRTWHRSTSHPVPLPPKQIVTGQNSYIRSGNTLVRKNAPATVTPIANASAPPASRSSSVYQLNPSGPIETRNTGASGIKSNNSNSRTAGSSAPVVRPKTPPLSGSNKLPDCPTYLRDLPSSPLEHLPASPVEGNFAVQKVSEDLTNNSESQKLQYVKRKSNQLVAAPSSDQSIQDLDKIQASLSDSYYKRSKNQLIRTSVGDDSAAITDVPKTSKNNIKRQSGKGISKKYHLLRFPSVWTLNNSRSSGKDGISLRQKKLRPQLFPWKRSSIASNNLSSSISRKLLLSRKRETIYTRSRHGFSLHMSKLLSVGGSSLKWSKSLERNSKRVNKEATLAVAAAEKKKRERHDTVDIKTRNNISRDRIFRIGLVRYKMDPSRRTLQKISDEEEPSTSTQSKEETRKSYIPKRLKIGHDEYVRIGNGNQLVRNPKRRTRIFANEKVRWSLHTARSRLAKKKKYCQFFTRFGKCNKDDGKCPYIHDSSKIAVCTKFLNGSCSNPNCKLTHKVIPERMQDCSYFLQGLCSNKLCPYRHVNVKSDASICEGFLKGFCADGNECRKKHTYACPVFEATGTCSQGTKCKLHHPKNRLKRKQQDSMEQHQKNARGRYFGSFMSDGGEAIPISEKHHHSKDDDDDDDDGNGDILCQEGKFAEYISLDFGNDEVGELTFDQRTTLISEPLGLDAADSDDLMKPVRIMNKVVSGSPSDCDVGVS